jgi:hypothetical protein
MKNAQVLRIALYAGAVYFLGISICHAFGWKIPVFYIYFDVVSMPYQDQIISLLAFGWSTFFYVAGRLLPAQTMPVRAILLSGAVALLSLARINFSTEFALLGTSGDVSAYWFEVGALMLYLLLLLIFYRRLNLQPVHHNPIR